MDRCYFFRSGISISNANPNINECLFYKDGITVTRESNPHIVNCTSEEESTIGFHEGSNGIVRRCIGFRVGVMSYLQDVETEPYIEYCQLNLISINGPTSAPTIKNCRINSDTDGIILADSSKPVIINNTITANTALKFNRYGTPRETVSFRNNIIAFCNNGYKAERDCGPYSANYLGIDYNILWQIAEPRIRIESLGEHDRIINPVFRGGYPFDCHLLIGADNSCI